MGWGRAGRGGRRAGAFAPDPSGSLSQREAAGGADECTTRADAVEAVVAAAVEETATSAAAIATSAATA